jgi:hypothetical protein
LLDLGRNQVGERAARPSAGIVDHEVGCRDLALDQPEQPLDLVCVGGVAGIGTGAGFAAKRAELFDGARGQRHANSFARK